MNIHRRSSDANYYWILESFRFRRLVMYRELMAVKFTCQLVAYTTLKLLQINSCHLDIWNLFSNKTILVHT